MSTDPLTQFLDFDPNKCDDNQPLWAVYDGYRLKTFHGSGPAASSFMRNFRSKLYQFKDGRWQLVTMMVGGRRERCDGCLRPTRDSDCYYSHMNYASDYAWRKNWGWRRTSNGSIQKPQEAMFVCKDCRRLGVAH